MAKCKVHPAVVLKKVRKGWYCKECNQTSDLTPNPSFRCFEGPVRRTIVVGDIHGCMAELMALLEEVSFGPEDLLVAVGDLVDRGPDSWGWTAFSGTHLMQSPC